MIARRLLVAAVAVAWLLPAMVAGAVALHVAFEHPAGHEHGATPHVVELLALTTDGDLDMAPALPHEHSAVVAAAGVAVRRVLASAPHDSTRAATAGLAPRFAASPSEPAERLRSAALRESGPPLLARLSTLRI